MRHPKPTNKRSFIMLQADPDTRKMLVELSAKNERTMSQQIRWLIQQAYQQMKAANVSK